MSIKYKIDIIATLKDKGYSTYRLRKEKLLSESTIQSFRTGELISWENVSRICKLLHCQPGDIMEYVEDEPTADEIEAINKSKNTEYIPAHKIDWNKQE